MFIFILLFGYIPHKRKVFIILFLSILETRVNVNVSMNENYFITD